MKKEEGRGELNRVTTGKERIKAADELFGVTTQFPLIANAFLCVWDMMKQNLWYQTRLKVMSKTQKADGSLGDP